MPLPTRQATLAIPSMDRLGESVLWHEARRCLYWVDLYEPALFRALPGAATHDRRPLPLPAPIGSIAATTDPGAVVISHRGGLSLLDLDTLSLTPFADPEGGRDAIIFNDLKCDRYGRLWVATSHAAERDPRGALWCVASARHMALGDAGFPIGNGPAFSPDGRLLYLNDSANRQTLAYDIGPDDLLPRNRRVLATYSEEEGMPDGLTVDVAGNIWTAQWGGGCVLKLDAAGNRLERIDLPAVNVTSLCFAGPDHSDMFITTARDGLSPEMLARYPLSGSLFRCSAGTTGLPEPLFRLART